MAAKKKNNRPLRKWSGKDLPARRRRVLEKAKDELRTLFDKD
ncbi:MAG TPA: DUF3175 domain-containing protein [Rhizomicrobium sp.]|nr:DUF3175 domain-containing protein [Rhizomicrobium sp.]